jgi:uncharacterized protein
MAEVVNNPAQHRYELVVEGHLAATYYKVADGVITFIHTEFRRNSAAKAPVRRW